MSYSVKYLSRFTVQVDILLSYRYKNSLIDLLNLLSKLLINQERSFAKKNNYE